MRAQLSAHLQVISFVDPITLKVVKNITEFNGELAQVDDFILLVVRLEPCIRRIVLHVNIHKRKNSCTLHLLRAQNQHARNLAMYCLSYVRVWTRCPVHPHGSCVKIDLEWSAVQALNGVVHKISCTSLHSPLIGLLIRSLEMLSSVPEQIDMPSFPKHMNKFAEMSQSCLARSSCDYCNCKRAVVSQELPFLGRMARRPASGAMQFTQRTPKRIATTFSSMR